MNQDKLKIPAIISDTTPEFDTTCEDDLMKHIREECENAADTLFVESLGDLYQGKIGPGEVFWLGEPEYVGKMPPAPELQFSPKKTIHAIAHFDFDGSCYNCPCVGKLDGDKEICQLSVTGFDIHRVPYDERHEDCPLCIEEE